MTRWPDKSCVITVFQPHPRLEPLSWVAAYFAVDEHDKEDGEIWTFDDGLYETEGQAATERPPGQRLTEG